MKQIVQSLRTGETEVAEVPCPRMRSGCVLIRTTTSLVSAGTERMLVEFGKANIIDKARQQPDRVRAVLEKINTDGLLPTINSVRNKLDQPLKMGYCNVGVVMEVGVGVTGFSVGDRVVSNGNHAEVVCVPKNLCSRVPDEVEDESAAFAVIGAIGLEGIRLSQPTLGEVFVVTGLGLIGLVTAQLLIAHGCRVLGIDFDPHKLALARQFGVETVDLSAGEDPISAARAFSRGRGVDGVLITASTKSSEPVHQAALMCRKRGRIVLVGVTGLELSRADFYEKELSFQVSCSYGPGRYDPLYEEGGQDYPAGFVRWTEQRNFEAVLDMMAAGKVHVRPLVSHRFSLEQSAAAYNLIGGSGASLGVLLQYADQVEQPDHELKVSTFTLPSQSPADSTAPGVGFIGAGNYSTQVLIPAFKKAGARLETVASSGGVSGMHAGRKFGFRSTTTDTTGLITDDAVNAVVVTTRHDSHTQFVCQALEAGKHVFVEKPLAINREQLDQVVTTYRSVCTAGRVPVLMVGFNRRFAPQVVKMKSLLGGLAEPKSMIMTVNAGQIPPEHWTQDPAIGGGRIIGEGCHFIDLLRFLAGHPIVSVKASALGGLSGPTLDDKVTFTITFADGSFGTVHYLADGHKSFPKERLEVFCAGRVLQLDNYRKLYGYGWSGFKSMHLWSQDKGHLAGVSAFLEAVRTGKPSPIPFEELVEVTRVSIEIAESVRSS